MKPEPLGRPMATARSLLGPLVLCLLVVVLIPPGTAHTDAGSHHVHLHVSLGQASDWNQDIPADQLHHRMEGTLRVETQDGETLLRFPLPTDTTLERFLAPGHETTTAAETRDIDGIPHAVLVWQEDPPEPDTELHDVRLVAVRNVDPEASNTIHWPALGDLTELDIRVEAPTGYTLLSARELIRQQHAPEGRHLWSTFDFRTENLHLALHPPYEGTDPSLAAPPHPLGGWLILFGIALVATAAWALGKRFETPTE